MFFQYYFSRLGIIFEIPDIPGIIYETLKKIPRGMVTTYKEIAKLLGDKIAARAVATVLARNEKPDEIPCFKVVMSDGNIGGYSLGVTQKINRLRQEGIKVEGTRIINFDRVLFKLSDNQYYQVLKSLQRIQNTLHSQITFEQFNSKNTRYAAATDLSYIQLRNNFDLALAAVVVYDLLRRKIVDLVFSSILINFPYIPTYLAFREVPGILLALENLRVKPDLLLIDGHGVLHPRRMGIACHIGVLTRIPSIGIAKRILAGKISANRIKAGDKNVYPVYLDGKIMGFCIEKSGKRIYVSPGFGITLQDALDFVLKLEWEKGREPFLMLLAHKLVTRFRDILRRYLSYIKLEFRRK